MSLGQLVSSSYLGYDWPEAEPTLLSDVWESDRPLRGPAAAVLGICIPI